jgi:hypothetical protein
MWFRGACNVISPASFFFVVPLRPSPCHSREGGNRVFQPICKNFVQMTTECASMQQDAFVPCTMLFALRYTFSRKTACFALGFIDPIPAGVYPREVGGGNDKYKKWWKDKEKGTGITNLLSLFLLLAFVAYVLRRRNELTPALFFVSCPFFPCIRCRPWI